jgi:hypothetical protein
MHKCTNVCGSSCFVLNELTKLRVTAPCTTSPFILGSVWALSPVDSHQQGQNKSASKLLHHHTAGRVGGSANSKDLTEYSKAVKRIRSSLWPNMEGLPKHTLKRKELAGSTCMYTHTHMHRHWWQVGWLGHRVKYISSIESTPCVSTTWLLYPFRKRNKFLLFFETEFHYVVVQMGLELVIECWIIRHGLPYPAKIRFLSK